MSDEMHHDEARVKLTELIREARIGMLTTMTPDGRHLSRPMGLQEAEFDGDLWFFAYEDSEKVRDIHANPQVNVAFTSSKGAWVSVSGSAEIVHDRAKAAELWHATLKGWFPEGLDTPGLTLIKVHADSAEYWDTPHGRVVTMMSYLASTLTGRTPDVGEDVKLKL